MKQRTNIIPVLLVLCVLLSVSAQMAIAKSVGVEWINNFAGTVNDRSHWDESAKGLYNEMTADGWSGKFCWGNADAWMSDFTTGNSSWIDSVDLALIGTHGAYNWDDFWGDNHSSVMFSTGSSDSFMHPGQVYNLWGNNNLEWIALDCCSVLRDHSVGHWSHAMNGLHLLMGFKNTMYVSLPGDGQKWGEYMSGNWFWLWDIPYNVTQSWFLAVDYVQPHGWTTVTARVLAEVSDNYNDYAWGEGYVSTDPVKDGWYHIWDHDAACKPPRRNLDAEDMLLYTVDRTGVSEDHVAEIAKNLGFSGEVEFCEDGYYRATDAVNDNTYFQMHETGALLYANMDKLFIVPEEAPALLGEKSIGAAAEFLSAAGIVFDGLGAPEFMTETVFEFDRDKDTKEPVSEMPVMDCVFFPHEITHNQTTYSVVGPGAKLKVYLGDRGEVLGCLGGWRSLQEGKETEVLSADEALELVYKYRDKVSLAKLPAYESFEVKDATLCYYEDACETKATTLFPTWLFTGEFFTKEGRQGGSFEGDLFVPAVPDFIPPVVEIPQPIDNASFEPGEDIQFVAEVSYGFGNSTIQWFSDQDGYLGEGRVITTTLSAASRAGEIMTHSVKAIATDSAGKIGTAVVTVLIGKDQAAPWVYLTLNNTMFNQGEDLKLFISGGNNSVGRNVNVYVFLVTPDSRLLFWPWWTGLAVPMTLYFPASFEILDLPILDATLPCMTPRIGAGGNYSFWAFLTDTSTNEMIGTFSEVGFTMY
ncbi:hypothetical protein J7M28_01175 [bacterium]|nr:hypothetical protein [bacterium]